MNKITCLLLLVFLSTNLWAQEGTVRGFIKSSDDGNAIPFVRVEVVELKVGANTDFNGFYSIPKLPVGTYTLKASNVEYVTFEEKINITNGNILSLNIEMEKGKVLGEVEVNAAEKEKKTEVQTSVIKISQKDILRVPTTGGDADIATYFQTVPGVVFDRRSRWTGICAWRYANSK